MSKADTVWKWSARAVKAAGVILLAVIAWRPRSLWRGPR